MTRISLTNVKTEILAGAKADAIVDSDGNTAIACAIANGDEALFDLLLRAGANVHQDINPIIFTGEPTEDEDGYTWPSQDEWPLIVAAAYAKQWSMVRKLIIAGADIHTRCYDTEDVAGHAILQNELSELYFLLEERHLKVNIRRTGGNTLLMTATCANNLEAVQMLLEHRADPFVDNRQERTPALVAVGNGMFSLFKAIIDYDWDTRKECWCEMLPEFLSVFFQPKFISILFQGEEEKEAGEEEVRYLLSKMLEFKKNESIQDALEFSLRRAGYTCTFRGTEPNITALKVMVEKGIPLNLNNPRMKGAYCITETLEAGGEAATLLRQAMLNDYAAIE